MSLIYTKASDVVAAIRHELRDSHGKTELIVDAALLRAAEEILTRLADDREEMAEQLDRLTTEHQALRADLDYLECRLEVEEHGEDPFLSLFDPLVA